LRFSLIAIALGSLLCWSAASAAPASPTCIVPSEPDGGFQLTCELVSDAMAASGALPQPLTIGRMPGGVGAIAFNVFTSTRRSEPGSLVAFSEGTLFNLANGKFGAHDASEVRWLAIMGLDHGTIVVQDKAVWRTLPELEKAMSERPQDIAIGGSGSINGRDWIRASSMAKLAGIDMRKLRFVAFDGGGDCMKALIGGHVQVCINDVASTQVRIDRGQPLRMLAIFSEARLPGKLSAIPTAREEGFDLVWPVPRGVYLGPGVSDADYEFWEQALTRGMQQPAYAASLSEHYILPEPLVGQALARFVEEHAKATLKEREPL
jgi:putative tricarboxylic transport membrane protein